MINYVNVDDKRRIEFEKEFHLPYGYYYSSVFDNIFDSEGDAIFSLIKKSMTKSIHLDDYVIERWEGGNREIIIYGRWLKWLKGDDSVEYKN